MNNKDKVKIKDVDLRFATNTHARKELLFVKHIEDSFNHLFTMFDLDKDSTKEVMEFLESKYDLTTVYQSDFSSEGGDASEDSTYTYTYLAKVDKFQKIMIYYSDTDLYIYSADKIDEEVTNKVKEIHKTACEERKRNSVHIMAYTEEKGIYLSNHKVDDKYANIDIDLNYNDDFADIHKSILNNLETNKIGLYLLHGKHGTGKTTYIRHLIRKTDKRVIFVSPSMADQFASPNMVPFLIKYPNSIIVIEDAENIIKKRRGGGDQSVSNLLNLSDGILGDCLKFQIICTFNTSKDDIDEALLRRGRLLESYEFNQLSLSKTNKLMKKLGRSNSNKALKLSDIYNLKDNHFDNEYKPISLGKNE